jgi:hypothetical protein
MSSLTLVSDYYHSDSTGKRPAHSWITVICLAHVSAFVQWLCFEYFPDLARELTKWSMLSCLALDLVWIIAQPLSSFIWDQLERHCVNTMIILCFGTRLLRKWSMCSQSPLVLPTSSWYWLAIADICTSALCEAVSAWTITIWLTLRIFETVPRDQEQQRGVDTSTAILVVLVPLLLSLTGAGTQILVTPTNNDPAPANVN